MATPRSTQKVEEGFPSGMDRAAEVGLAGQEGKAAGVLPGLALQAGAQLPAGGQDGLAGGLELVLVVQHGGPYRLGQAVDVVGGFHRPEGIGQRLLAHGEAQAQGGHTEGLGAGAQDDEVVEALHFGEHGLVGEVHIGLVRTTRVFGRAVMSRRRSSLPHTREVGLQGLLKMRSLYPLIVAGLDEFVKAIR